MNYQSYFKFSELFKFGDDADGEEFGLENEPQKQSQPTREDSVRDKEYLEAINVPDPGKYSIQTQEFTYISCLCLSGGTLGSWQQRHLQNEALSA